MKNAQEVINEIRRIGRKFDTDIDNPYSDTYEQMLNDDELNFDIQNSDQMTTERNFVWSWVRHLCERQHGSVDKPKRVRDFGEWVFNGQRFIAVEADYYYEGEVETWKAVFPIGENTTEGDYSRVTRTARLTNDFCELWEQSEPETFAVKVA